MSSSGCISTFSNGPERRFLYSFFAELYSREVTVDTLLRLRHLEVNVSDRSPIAVAIAGMRDAVENDESDDRLIENLAVDFANIFLGANLSSRGAYPYESVYTSPEGLLRQDSTDEVLHAYRLEGLGQGMEGNVPDDHIALEFSFMDYLIAVECEASKQGDVDRAGEYVDKQRQFFFDHIDCWVQPFFSAGKEIAKTMFYRQLFVATEEFMLVEKAHLLK